MATAKNRAVDHHRRRAQRDRKHRAMRDDPAYPSPAALSKASDEDVADDVLRLILIACHPVVPRPGRAALTLRLIAGLSTYEIARAFLVAESTIAQRIVRAKRTLREARVPFEVPRGEALVERLESVLEVIYLIFNEGYTATRGDDWMRPALCDQALRIGRMLAELVTSEALDEFQRAAAMAQNKRERTLLERRAARLSEALEVPISADGEALETTHDSAVPDKSGR